MWRALIAVIALNVLPQAATIAAQYSDRDRCLRYQAVELTGRLTPQTLAGAPDYESVTGGDKPVVIRVLLLDQRICVVDPDPRYPRAYGERQVQLLLEPDQYERYRDLLTRRVVVAGLLRPGNGRYDKPLVLITTGIRKADVRPAH